MAAQTPSQSYVVSARSTGDADSKCKSIKTQNPQWTSCSVSRK